MLARHGSQRNLVMAVWVCSEVLGIVVSEHCVDCLLLCCSTVDAGAYQPAAPGQLSDQQQGSQQLHRAHTDSVDSLVRALPTHISDFGESAPDDDAAGGAAAPAVPAADAAAAGTDGGTAHHLPSHISAFGDDLGPLPGGRGMLSAGEDLEDNFAAGAYVQTQWGRQLPGRQST